MPDIRFDDYHVCTDDDILEITSQGIRLRNGAFIDFAVCAANFAAVHGDSGRCVAERDISGSHPSFGFYTAPMTTHIFFMPKRRLLLPDDSHRRFHALQQKIEGFCYITYDIS